MCVQDKDSDSRGSRRRIRKASKKESQEERKERDIHQKSSAILSSSRPLLSFLVSMNVLIMCVDLFFNDVCILFISSYDPRHVIFIFSPSSPFDSHSNYWSIISSLDEEDSSMSYVERSEAARREEDDLKKLFLQHRNHIYIRSHIHSHIHRRESYKREHVNTHITLLVFEEKRSRAEEPFDSFCGVKEEVSYNSRFMYKKVLSNFLMTGLSLIPA